VHEWVTAQNGLSNVGWRRCRACLAEARLAQLWNYERYDVPV